MGRKRNNVLRLKYKLIHGAHVHCTKLVSYSCSYVNMYSRTSLSGHSEKRTHSLERTKL